MVIKLSIQAGFIFSIQICALLKKLMEKSVTFYFLSIETASFTTCIKRCKIHQKNKKEQKLIFKKEIILV
jgi:hypothetical protein